MRSYIRFSNFSTNLQLIRPTPTGSHPPRDLASPLPDTNSSSEAPRPTN